MKAAVYIRVSSVQQSGDERFGYPRQRDEIGRYAAERDLDLVSEFKDAVTGKSATRTGLTKLKDASSGFDAVVISSVDRLARDVSTSYKVLAELLDLGLEVHSSDFGPIDLKDEMSLVQFNFRTLFAHLERNAIVRRTRAAHLAMAERGLLPIGIKTYGYRGEGGRAVIDPVQALVVRRIFELSAAGASLFRIQETLNAEGVPVARPGQSKQQGTPLWHRTVVGKVLANPAYKGEHRWGRFALSVPPIVSPELWGRAQKRKRGVYPSSGWPLVGHLRCGVCGRRMVSRTERKTRSTGVVRYESYRCQSASLPTGTCGGPGLHRADLEARAEEAVRRTLSDPDTIRQLLADHTPPNRALERELEGIAEEDARWLEAFRLGAITPAELGEYRRELSDKRRALQTAEAQPDYPVETYAAAARDLPFAELLEAASVVVIATRESVRLTLEPSP